MASTRDVLNPGAPFWEKVDTNLHVAIDVSMQSDESALDETMKPAKITVLVITAAFLGFCIWIERHSRSQ